MALNLGKNSLFPFEKPEDPVDPNEIPEDKQDFVNEREPFFQQRFQYLVNYDWQDIVSDQGYATYYLANAQDSSAATVNMITAVKADSYTQKSTASAGNANSGTYSKEFDEDFDLLVNRPVRINGKVIVVLTLHTAYDYDAFDAYWRVRLRKWDGSTETEIASAKTENLTNLADIDIRRTFIMDVSDSSFKKDEYIRITVEGWVANSANSGSLIGVWHDPTSRQTLGVKIVSSDGEDADSGTKTDAVVLLPFKVDI